MSNRKKHADGYLPKIAYHITKGNTKAINWFTEQHEEKYGPLTFDDISKVIKKSNGLKNLILSQI